MTTSFLVIDHQFDDHNPVAVFSTRPLAEAYVSHEFSRLPEHKREYGYSGLYIEELRYNPPLEAGASKEALYVERVEYLRTFSIGSNARMLNRREGRMMRLVDSPSFGVRYVDNDVYEAFSTISHTSADSLAIEFISKHEQLKSRVPV